MKNDLIHIDPSASVSSTVRLRIADDSTLHIGADCTLADGVEIEIAEEGAVQIGRGVCVGPNALLRGHGDIRIEENVVIDAGVVIDTREFVRTATDAAASTAPVLRPIRIGPGAIIGANAVLRAGITIGANAAVPPCTFVDQDFSADNVIPNRPNGSRSALPGDTRRRRFLFGFCRWHETARHFVTLANTLRAANIDSRLYGTPLTLSRLDYLRTEQAIAREDLTDLESVLDDWRPDIIFLWSGATQIDGQIIDAADRRGIECRFAELGWFPQSRTIHFDTEGTNARSSIRRLDVDRLDIDPRLNDWLASRRHSLAEPPPDVRNYIFVPLQDIRDANITLGSPYASMDAFVTALADRFPNETFVVRPHPNFSDVPLTAHPNVHVRRDRSIHPWLQHADAVVGINSTALLEALVYAKPTHAVGTGLSTNLDVLFDATSVDTLEIRREISIERMDRVHRLLSELVFVRQAWMKDLHYLDRLPGIYGLGDLLASTDSPQRATPTHDSALPARS